MIKRKLSIPLKLNMDTTMPGTNLIHCFKNFLGFPCHFFEITVVLFKLTRKATDIRKYWNTFQFFAVVFPQILEI